MLALDLKFNFPPVQIPNWIVGITYVKANEKLLKITAALLPKVSNIARISFRIQELDELVLTALKLDQTVFNYQVNYFY